jgi:hypothetical protein
MILVLFTGGWILVNLRLASRLGRMRGCRIKLFDLLNYDGGHPADGGFPGGSLARLID